MFEIIDVNTGEDFGYYGELTDAINDFMKAIDEESERVLVIIDTERETVVRWAF